MTEHYDVMIVGVGVGALANGSNQAGRNYMSHNGKSVVALSKKRNARMAEQVCARTTART